MISQTIAILMKTVFQSADDQSVYEVRGNLSYIRAGSLFQHKSFTTSKLPLRMIYWLKQSFIIALLRFSFDKAFTKNSQEVTAQNVAAKTKNSLKDIIKK